MLENLFKLSENATNVRTELIAGLTTFLTMAYIAFVNPSILAAAGMDQGAVFVATCLAAAIGSAIMGLWANYPIALAPGMGLNAFFAYTVVLTLGHSWQTALGAVFIAGVLFLLLSLFKVREWIINAIPRSLKLSIAAGIGMFLGIIGLKNAGIVVDHPATLVTLGDLTQGTVLIAVFGFMVMAALDARRLPGAITIAILLATLAAIFTGLSQATSVFAAPPSLMPTLFRHGPRRRPGRRFDHGNLRLPLRRFVRHRRHADRRRPSRRYARQGRQAAAARQGVDGRFGLDRRWRGARHLDDDQLHRERRRREGRRAHRVDRRHGRRPVPVVPVLLAARRHHPALRHGAGAGLRRLHDDARHRRGRLGGRHRIRGPP